MHPFDLLVLLIPMSSLMYMNLLSLREYLLERICCRIVLVMQNSADPTVT